MGRSGKEVRLRPAGATSRQPSLAIMSEGWRIAAANDLLGTLPAKQQTTMLSPPAVVVTAYRLDPA